MACPRVTRTRFNELFQPNMSELKMNTKPSVTIGWDDAGKMHIIKLGDAQETLEAFKKERDQENYVRVRWYRKMRHDKSKDTRVSPKQMVSGDHSKYDGDAGQALLKQEQAEKAASKVIVDDPGDQPKKNQKQSRPVPEGKKKA